MVDHEATNWQSRVLGRYRLQYLLGRGGMGEVWQAEDMAYPRQVAIKLLHSVLTSDQNYLRIFEYEARAAASLNHPHILAVHDFGEERISEDEVVTYLVMPCITGGTLRDRIYAVKGPLYVEESFHYLKQAAQAIDYAHSQQVLHRDIKPSNMLLSNGWLQLADFGIAKLLSSDTYRSQTNTGAGTPEYIAPEQARGQAEAASDRYSLAIIAYQLFTGQLPFRGETTYEILLKQISAPPPPPRQINPYIPQTVENVLLKGLSKQPLDRYSSSVSFVEALEMTWQGRPLPVDSDPEATIFAPWSKRKQQMEIASHPTVVASPSDISTFSLSPLMAPMRVSPHGAERGPVLQSETSVPTEISHSPELPKLSPELQERPAEQSPHKLGRRRLLIGGGIAVVAVASSVTPVAIFNWSKLQSLVSAPAPIPGPHTFVSGRAVLNITGHSGTVSVVAWDPSGRYLASGGEDSRVMLWDLGNILQKFPTSLQALNQPIRQWKFAQQISSLGMAWAPDGGSLAVSAGETGKFYMINTLIDGSTPRPIVNTMANTADPLSLLGQPTYRQVSWKPHTNILGTVEQGFPQQIKLDYWQSNKLSAPLGSYTYNDPTQPQDASPALLVANWSLDGSLLAGLLSNLKVVIWDTQKNKTQTVLQLPDRLNGQNTTVYREALTWSPVDPDVLAVFDIDIIVVFDVRKSQPLYLLGTNDVDAHTPPQDTQGLTWFPQVHGISWSPNGRYIAASYSRSSKVSVWDLKAPHPQMQNGIRLQQYLFPQPNEPGHNNTILDLAWSPDGRYLATGSFDQTVIIWQVDKG